MLDLSTCLKYYSRPEIQKALLATASSRELGTRFLKGHFGKRPDVLFNDGDVLEFAKQGVSSFHISEEHWQDPLQLSPSMKKKDMETLRTGWDLIIDIDCPDWLLSKRIAHVIITILKKHNIKSISCKFSGNKGFHIGVPMKAFPTSIHRKPLSSFFPDGVKRILAYIADYAEGEYSDFIKGDFSDSELSERLKIDKEKLFKNHKKETFEYVCERCGDISIESDYKDFIKCKKCTSIVRSLTQPTKEKPKLDFSLILGLDEILISPRHLYRMAYSLHEKSGLASLPIEPETVLDFSKASAQPGSVTGGAPFLDDTHADSSEGELLILRVLDYKPTLTYDAPESFKSAKTSDEVDFIQDNVLVEFFPPSIIKMLEGVKDGKKRALFVLINFLTCVGWPYEDIDELLHVWNAKNQDPLRETIIKTQLNYHKTQKKKILPPNYSNAMYYADLGVLSEEEVKVKNPVAFTKRRLYFFNQQKKRSKKNPKEDPKSQKKEDKPSISEKKD